VHVTISHLLKKRVMAFSANFSASDQENAPATRCIYWGKPSTTAKNAPDQPEQEDMGAIMKLCSFTGTGEFVGGGGFQGFNVSGGFVASIKPARTCGQNIQPGLFKIRDCRGCAGINDTAFLNIQPRHFQKTSVAGIITTMIEAPDLEGNDNGRCSTRNGNGWPDKRTRTRTFCPSQQAKSCADPTRAAADWNGC